jgi:hypothetical protein
VPVYVRLDQYASWTSHNEVENDHGANDFFFNQLPRYRHRTKREMSGTLYFDDMNERSVYENENEEKKV